MDLAPFEELVTRLAGDIPREYFDGITEVVVSPRTRPHPDRADIFTLGECIPLGLDAEGSEAVQSRIVLYWGSFRALAELDADFDWPGEAWETLTHEVRHHVEWRARRDDLEDFDRAAEQNFARHDGEPFDPTFYLDGRQAAPELFQVGDDWFIDRVVKQPPLEVRFRWHGGEWMAAVPEECTLPAYLSMEGVEPVPPAELIVVLRQRPRMRDLMRTPVVYQVFVPARPLTAEE